MDFNQRFMDIKFKMKEKERLLSLKSRAEAQLNDFERKKSQLHESLKKEEKDVEKLEGMSLTRFIHFIKKDTGDALFKEQQEAIAAKMRYDGVCSEVEALKGELENIQRQLNTLTGLKNQYDALLREKEVYIKNNALSDNNAIEEIVEKQAEVQRSIKELQEALYAGEELGDALKNVQESLNSAANWGVYDMVGGGLFATIAKHSRLDEANAEINRAQSLLSRFHRELQDVGEQLDININIDSFLTFADYFFDGFFADWAVQNKIKEAQSRVEDTVYRVDSILSKIEEEIREADQQYENLESKRRDTVEKA